MGTGEEQQQEVGYLDEKAARENGLYDITSIQLDTDNATPMDEGDTATPNFDPQPFGLVPLNIPKTRKKIVRTYAPELTGSGPGGDISWRSFSGKLGKAESSGGKYMYSKTSSASGKYQIIDSNIKAINKRYGTNYSTRDKVDPVKGEEIAEKWYNMEMSNFSRKINRKPTKGEAYAMWFFGSDKAASFITKPRDNTAVNYVSNKVAKANPSIFYNRNAKRYRTVGEVLNLLSRKVS